MKDYNCQQNKCKNINYIFRQNLFVSNRYIGKSNIANNSPSDKFKKATMQKIEFLVFWTIRAHI